MPPVHEPPPSTGWSVTGEPQGPDEPGTEALTAEPRGKRWRARFVVAVVVVALGAGAITGITLFGGHWAPADAQNAHAPQTTTGAPSVDREQQRDQQQVAALTALLEARSKAVLAHDREGWLATVDSRNPAFRRTQGAVFDNFQQVPFSAWSYEYLGRAPDLSLQRIRALGGGPGTDVQVWVARVLAGYRLSGFDTKMSIAERYLTLVGQGDHWGIAATSDGGTAPQPWDLGPIGVVRGDRVIVLGTAPDRVLRTYAAAGDRAVRRVSAVWGNDWSRRAVLVVPRTQAEFGRLLLRDGQGLSQVAAVTTGELSDGRADGSSNSSSSGRAGNDRIVANPGAFDRLGATGQRVVLTHEMTHVAIRQSTTSAVPIWLSEGFADLVGYRGTGVSRAVGAGDLLAQVRAGHGPKALPTVDDFDPTRTTIAPAYSAAWLACLRIEDIYGLKGLVAFYRTAATAPAGGTAPDLEAQVAAAFPAVLGVSEAAFTKSWLRYIQRLATE